MKLTQYRFSDSRLLEVVSTAADFFNGTPRFSLPVSDEPFNGSGVYGLYYHGNHAAYQYFSENQSPAGVPIYIGKAVPPGWRQGRESAKAGAPLHSRLKEHTRSITQGDGLLPEDFSVRIVILDGSMTALIGSLESTLINKYRPLWNSCIDGFGNHDPGKGRYEQSRSEWDTLHPGRPWAERLSHHKDNATAILAKIKTHRS